MHFRTGSATSGASATRVGVAGAAVMAVAFGMARYAFGLTLPGIRADLAVPELVLGLIASGTFVGFLLSLILSTPLATWKGPRAPTTLGGVCGTAGCSLVAVAPSPLLLAVGALVAGSAAGWVWAPYSAIVAAVAPESARPRLLARITTGACVGFVVVGPLAFAAAAWASWRWTWAVIAIASAVVTVLNIRWVPRLPPAPRPLRRGHRVVLTRGMLRPLAFSVMLFVAATAYFTYATDAALSGGLGTVAGPAVFVVAGTTGLAGLGAGRLTSRVGPVTVAVGALLALGAALLLLGVGADSLLVVLASAVVFGIGQHRRVRDPVHLDRPGRARPPRRGLQHRAGGRLAERDRDAGRDRCAHVVHRADRPAPDDGRRDTGGGRRAEPRDQTAMTVGTIIGRLR